MKKYLITTLLLLTGCGQQLGGDLTPLQQEIQDNPYLQLKADTDKILYSEEKDECDDITCATKHRIKSYDYISDKKDNGKFEFKDRDYTNYKIVAENGNEKTIDFYTGDRWYKDKNGDVYLIEWGATTTVEAFDLLTETKPLTFEWIKEYFLGKEALATDYSQSKGLCQTKSDAVWATAHDATTAGGTSGGSGYLASFSNSGYQIDRYFGNFDTSAIGAGSTITAASLAAYMGRRGSGSQTAYNIYNSSHINPFDYNDFDLGGTTAWSTAKNWADITPDGTFTFTFNAAGLAGINKATTTYLSAREANRDVADVQPSTFEYTNFFYMTTPPVLSVTFSAGGGTATTIKDDGLILDE